MLRRSWGGLFLITVALAALSGCNRSGNQTTLDPNAVNLDGALANTFVQADQPTAIKARLRVTATSPESSQRPPVNLALVVDTSGSMEGDPIEHARDACQLLLEQLAEGDRLAVVGFDSRTNVLVESTELEPRELAGIREQIGSMTAQGTTDLAGGLNAGLQQVLAHHDANGINRIVLLSDGVPNDASSIEGLAQQAGGRGVTITALGLGLEYDETLLGAIAQQSGGRFHYIEDSSQVAEVFEDELLRLERVVGRNAYVDLMPGPGIAIENVVGQQTARQNRGVRVNLGELVEGETRELVVQLAVNARRDGASVELFDTVLTFDDALVQAGRLERRLFLGARATVSESNLAEGRNEEVERDATRIEAAAATVEAIRIARQGELERAQALLAAEAERVRATNFGTDDSFASEEVAGDLDVLQDALPAVAGVDASVEVEEERTSRFQRWRDRRRSRRNRAAASEAAPAPASAPSVIREVHDAAMSTIRGQKA